MLDRFIRSAGRILKQHLPNYGVFNRPLLGLTFRRNHGRWPFPTTHLAAGFEDFLIQRIVADTWSCYDRACVDKVDAKRIVHQAHPSLRVSETADVIPYREMNSWRDLKDRLSPYFAEPLIAKPTHNSGGIVFLNRDHSDSEIQRLFEAGRSDYFYGSRDTIYYGLPKRIIVEQDLSQNDVAPDDFKFFCANGDVILCQIDVGRFEDHRRAMVEPTRYEPLDVTYTYEKLAELPPKPQAYDDMIAICQQLSRGFDFVRIDLYGIGSEVYFGEFSMSPGGGMEVFSVDGFSRELLKRIRSTSPVGSGSL